MCYLFLGHQYYGDDDQKNRMAFSYYKKSSDMGNSTAAVMLGLCYGNGDGVDMDKKKSFDSYLLAAERGNPLGMMPVGQYYFEGIGVKRDPEKALIYLLKAKANGMGAIATKYIDERYVLSEKLPFNFHGGTSGESELSWRLKTEPETAGHIMTLRRCKELGFSSVWDVIF